MNIILFEDEKVSNFYPITRLRTTSEIRTGRWTQKERVALQYNAKPLTYSTRELYCDEFKVDDTLFLNARLRDFGYFRNLRAGTCVVNKDGDILGYRGNKIIGDGNFDDYKVDNKDIPIYNFIWDVIAYLPERLKADLSEDPSLGKILSPINEDYVHIKNKKNVYIGNNVELGAGVVLDAEDAPIWIDDNSTVQSHTCIIGPSFIGKKSKVKPGSLLDIVAIGDVVKISGEIEGSIFQGYSNKQHLGFLGHAFVAEWVNLGAGTTNSDLKNNYSKVSVILEGKRHETGMQFLGTIIGDHSKAAINTTFNTGTIVEPFCNIFGRGYPPKYVPPFSWWGDCIEEYKLDKAIDTAAKVMKRRNIDLSEHYRKKVEQLFIEARDIRKKIK